MGAVAALLMAAPSIAQAAWGQATGSVNMRTGPAASYAKITTLPAGARVWIDGKLNGWYHLIYNGRAGFVSGSYITTRIAVAPRLLFRSPAPHFGYMQRPWWDNQHQAWYDGHRWYRNGIWYNDPSGFSFGFSFGR
jgi:uncharacterized protein YraI